ISVNGSLLLCVRFPEKIRSRNVTEQALRRRNNNSIRHFSSTRTTFAHADLRVLLAFIQDEPTQSQVVFASQSFCWISLLEAARLDRLSAVKSFAAFTIACSVLLLSEFFR